MPSNHSKHVTPQWVESWLYEHSTDDKYKDMRTQSTISLWPQIRQRTSLATIWSQIWIWHEINQSNHCISEKNLWRHTRRPLANIISSSRLSYLNVLWRRRTRRKSSWSLAGKTNYSRRRRIENEILFNEDTLCAVAGSGRWLPGHWPLTVPSLSRLWSSKLEIDTVDMICRRIEATFLKSRKTLR